MEWINAKDRLPTLMDKLCLFIQWNDDSEAVIQEYVGTVANAMHFREFDIKYRFTHWTYIPKPKSNYNGHTK